MTSDRSRLVRGSLTSTALLPLLVGCSVAEGALTSPHSPTTTTAATAANRPGSALAALLKLPTKGRAPKTGYSRNQFGKAWDDNNTDLWGHNGCPTREDILKRDLTNVVFKSGHCKVASGLLPDPYTGNTITFTRGATTSSAVQIDHVVPLGNAWVTGAQQLPAQQRLNLANDPLELLAVDGPANQQKSDGDAATWLPANKSFRCRYVAIQVAVKTKYNLWVTLPEKAAIARVLATCPTQPLPVEPGGR